MNRFGYRKAYIICDRITFEIAGNRCEKLLREAGLEASVLILKHMGFDEATLGEIVLNKPDDCDVMIGCGTGSITDMLRFSSFKLGLPCFTVATGAPMDGFSASVGIMNVDNLKATMPAHSTEVIIGDTDILKGAPYRMTVAGFGDLVGKLNALNDWRLGRAVNGEHYCEKIADLVAYYVEDILGKAGEIRNRDPRAIGDVMNALLLTGASISLYGTSRAISGAEHHMSHYWEVLGDQRGKPFAMHGEQVAVATVLTLSAAERLRDRKIDFDRAREAARNYDPENWKKEIRRAYGNASDAIISLEEKVQKNETSGRLRRIASIEAKWAEIREILDGMYSSEELRGLLRSLECPCDPKDIGISTDILKDTFLYSKDTRAIFTISQMIWDLGLMEEISDEIIGSLTAQGRIADGSEERP